MKAKPTNDFRNIARGTEQMQDMIKASEKKDGCEPKITVPEPLESATLAVQIDSTVLGAPIWFALVDENSPELKVLSPELGAGTQDSLLSTQDCCVFYASELPALRTKSPEQLREIFKVKTAFCGGRVRK